MPGSLRRKMMNACPEEFEGELKGYIDDIERRLNKIKNKMNITSINKLSDIEEAYDDLGDLADDLY